MLCVLASVVSFMWIGPWAWFLLGGYLFYGLLLGLAITAAESHWYLAAPPLVCAFVGGTWAAICLVQRKRQGLL
jgi:hypothetical protein